MILRTCKLLTILLIGLAASCASVSGGQNTILRQAENTPEAFTPPPGITLDGQSCKSPMIDSRDGTQIIMVSASGGKGNYRVPPGKYGVQKGELLRLDCATGKVLGVVKD